STFSFRYSAFRDRGQAIMKRDKHLRPTPNQARRDLRARQFWDAIDREEFEFALSANDKYNSFVGALRDPRYSRCSFPKLLRKFGISLHEATSLYVDHMRCLSLFVIANHLPAIMEDVCRDARSHMEACPRCDGEKVVDSKRGGCKVRKTCPNCD